MKISVIIPSFNEATTLKALTEKVLRVKLPYTKEIIIVDDGSTDNTQEIFKEFSNNKTLKLITNSKNLGKGASIIRALKIVKGNVIIIQDADLEYNPVDIPRLLAPFRDRNIKVVYGSRVLGNNPVSHWTFNLGGKLVTLITNILFQTDITDEPTGYKLFRKEILKNLKLNSRRFEFCPEVTAKIAKAGIQIKEVPISYKPRPVSEKKIKWYDGLAAIYFLLKYRFAD